MTAVTLPQLSISMEDGKVGRWLVADGDEVLAGQLLVEVETDKATVEIEAPTAGLVRIVAAEGSVVPVEGVLAELQPAAPGAATAPPAEPAASTPPSAGAPVHLPPANGAVVPERRAGPIASPAARRLAGEQGVELASLQGTGPGGRIVARDVVGSRELGEPVAPASADRLRDAVVRNITASWQQIPHVHIGGELVVEGLVQAREAPALAGSGATVTDFLILALARALTEVPELNAVRRVDGSVERSPAVHLSLAVATAAGVVAPVIRDAGSRTLEEVVQERRRLVEAARLGTSRAGISAAARALSRISALTPWTSSRRSCPGRRWRWSPPAVSWTRSSPSTGRSASGRGCGSTSPSTIARRTARRAVVCSPRSSASSRQLPGGLT